jgi:hypothetical protein
MGCLTDPIGCGINLLGSGASDIVSSAWDSICQSFANAATSLLTGFANDFVNIPDVDVASPGIKSVYSISLGIAVFVSALLLFYQVIRTAVTRDGAPLAHGLVGIGKSALASAVTLTVAGTALVASDGISRYIIDNSFGSTAAFSKKISTLVSWNPSLSGSLLLIFAIIAILLIAVLWVEMLFRNAAVAILVATSPIGAAGMISEATQSWWTRFATSTIQLIILKPIVALVFALGFSMAGDSQDIETTLSGMLVLLLGAIAWPAVARFFSFASVQAGGGMGLGALLGFAGGRLSAASGGSASGVSPDQFGQEAAGRTMANFASRSGAGQGAGAAAGGGGSAASAGGAAVGGAAAAAGPIGLAVAGVAMAQKAANAMSSGMEQMAGHAGMGANPYMQPAGQPVQRPNSPPGAAGPAASCGAGGQQPAGPVGTESSTPPQQTTAYSNPSTQELPVTGVDPAMPDFESPPDPPTAELPTTNYDPNTEAGEDA